MRSASHPVLTGHRTGHLASWLTLTAGVLSFGGCLAGCAHDPGDAQLALLQAGIDREVNDRDRHDPQLDAVRIQQEEQAKLPRPGTGAPPTPVPNVVAIGSGRSEPASTDTASALNGDDINDTSPRPVIRVLGSGIVRRGGRGPEDRIEETLPDEPAEGRVGPPIVVGAPPSSALDPNAKKAYDAALAMVNAHDFDHALDAFAAFIVKWPDHPNADNAMYWRGECYFAKGEFVRAAEEFDGAVKRFPLGNKVPDCLLKLGICQQKLGNQPRAKVYFDRLAHDFPRSEAARRIPAERPAGPRGAGPEETP
jgi:tol-pal system protein YbgF